jgi:DnaJ homolog subfamily A member 2
LYNGKTVKLAVNRQVLVGEPKICTTCDGQGAVIELRQIALGMVQQLQRNCTDCSGEGYQCKRQKERKVLEVHIEKGMKHNQKVTFRGMADEKPNMEAGNINFILQEKEHELFKRKAADLLITKTLSLNEALCGFEWKVTHLDKREVIVQSKAGEVIQAEGIGGTPFVKVVKNEGMPSIGNPFVRGDLYVLFTVEFPKDGELDAATVATLKKALPNPGMEVEYDKDTAEVVHLEKGDVKSFGKGGVAASDMAYDEDDDEGGGQQPVQCQQS